MPQNLTDVDEFTDPVQVALNGEDADNDSLELMLQQFANRTRYLYNLFNGSNVRVGNGALSDITTGLLNVALGEDAGSSIQDGNNNILLGANCNTPAPDSEDFLNIGNTIFGDIDGQIVRIGGASDEEVAVEGALQLWSHLLFLEDASSPEIYQTGAEGESLTIRAQDGDVESGGGNLALRGGSNGAGDYGTVQISMATGGLAFFGSAGTTKQTVSGSTVDGTALQSLLDALVAYGLIDDVTNDS
jgi:hypothetical protein